MVRQATESTRADEIPQRPRVTARELVSIRRTLDELGCARCPLCRAILVARQGRAGPYFACSCPPTATRRTL